MQSVNPATGDPIRTYSSHDGAAVAGALNTAVQAQAAWRQSSFTERAGLFHATAALLRSQSGHHARLMTLEMGKPIAAAEAEVEKCAWVCDYFADNIQRFLAEEAVATDASRSFVRYEPLGTVLAVMPWNFPYWQVVRCAAPAMLAGNAVILKHASNVPGCALAIERIFHEAGFPEGLFATLLIRSTQVRALIEHPAISAVSLTGSEAAGRAVASAAGRVIKKTVLELGGSDPFIVLADADPAHAAEQATTARTINNGQSCIAAKRFIVEEPIANAFERELTDRMAALRVGDPMDPHVQVGPLARSDLRTELHDQVERSCVSGAGITTGGTIPEGPGFFYPPTVLTGVRPGMTVFDEETFGPVAAVTRAESAEDAIALANQSRFGSGRVSGQVIRNAGANSRRASMLDPSSSTVS